MSTIVLPARQGLGSLAGRATGNILTGAATGLFEGLQQKREREEKAQKWKRLFPDTAQAQRTNDLASREPRQMQPQASPVIPNEAIAMVAEEDPQLARILQEQNKMAQKERAESSKQHFEIAKDVLKSANEKAQSLIQKENALDLMKSAIEEGNLGFFSGDNLAEITGIEGLRSPHGSLFKTASKEYFLGNLSRIGARGLNQWIERQIDTMAPKLGRSRQANLVVSEALQAENDVIKKEIELTEKIANEQEAQFGGVRRNLASEVAKELRPYAIERQKELKSKIENINETYQPVNKEGLLMRDPAGNLRRVSAKDVKAAKAAGYKQEK